MMYSPAHRQQLLQLAEQSISSGLEHGRPLSVNVDEFDLELQQQRASFVTLHEAGQLRGCIGSLEAHRALVEDVAENAYAAAFRDPRFGPLRKSEFELLQISISVLSPSTSIQFESEQDLIAQMRPGEDGLILREGFHKGTFLPSVWEQLPEADQFLQHLKIKAGLNPDYWSDSIQVSRYQTESFP